MVRIFYTWAMVSKYCLPDWDVLLRRVRDEEKSITSQTNCLKIYIYVTFHDLVVNPFVEIGTTSLKMDDYFEGLDSYATEYSITIDETGRIVTCFVSVCLSVCPPICPSVSSLISVVLHFHFHYVLGYENVLIWNLMRSFLVNR